ncbi:MAG: hypothetical protein A4S09_16170 [Proteobacteria bacterium SG_bin7]|nr:MAG: hypothetical protein A4S09_16170 [Proteobacteria bacterium SG_bin7]
MCFLALLLPFFVITTEVFAGTILIANQDVKVPENTSKVLILRPDWKANIPACSLKVDSVKYARILSQGSEFRVSYVDTDRLSADTLDSALFFAGEIFGIDLKGKVNSVEEVKKYFVDNFGVAIEQWENFYLVKMFLTSQKTESQYELYCYLRVVPDAGASDLYKHLADYGVLSPTKEL